MGFTVSSGFFGIFSAIFSVIVWINSIKGTGYLPIVIAITYSLALIIYMVSYFRVEENNYNFGDDSELSNITLEETIFQRIYALLQTKLYWDHLGFSIVLGGWFINLYITNWVLSIGNLVFLFSPYLIFIIHLFGIFAIYILAVNEVEISNFSAFIFYLVITHGVGLIIINMIYTLIDKFVPLSLDVIAIIMEVESIIINIWVGLPIYLVILVVSFILSVAIFLGLAALGWYIGEREYNEKGSDKRLLGVLGGGFIGGAIGLNLLQAGVAFALEALIWVNSLYFQLPLTFRTFYLDLGVLIDFESGSSVSVFLGLGLIILVPFTFIVGYLESSEVTIDVIKQQFGKMILGLVFWKYKGQLIKNGKRAIPTVNMLMRINWGFLHLSWISIPFFYPFFTLAFLPSFEIFNIGVSLVLFLNVVFILLMFILGIIDINYRFSIILRSTKEIVEDTINDSIPLFIIRWYLGISLMLLFSYLVFISTGILGEIAVGLLFIEACGYFTGVFIRSFLAQ